MSKEKSAWSAVTFTVAGILATAVVSDVADAKLPAVSVTPPVANAYIEDVVPIILADAAYPNLIVLWAVGNGTEALPIRILAYDRNSNAYTDRTSKIIAGKIPTVWNPRNFIVADLNRSGHPSIAIANQGIDGPPWTGATNTMLLSKASGQLVDFSSLLPRQAAFSHDIAEGLVTRTGDVGIYVSTIGNAPRPGTPPEFVTTNLNGRFKSSSMLLPPNLRTLNIRYTAAALLDINGDGLADLVLGPIDQAAGPPVAYLNPGNGNFAAVRPITLPSSPLPAIGGTGPTVLDIRPIHISSAKYCDLVVVSTNANYSGYAFQILINDGKGNFRDETHARVSGAPIERVSKTDDSYWLKRVWVVEVDGVPDLVTEAAGDLTVPSQIFLNDGRGKFALKTSVTGMSFANVATFGGALAVIETNYESITLEPFP
jgi:hypothetical protein